ncbi:MAG: FAD-dependent oxidoreductase [Cellvibrionaceae bacterium]
MAKKIIIVLIISLAIAVFFIFDLQEWLTFEKLQASQSAFDEKFNRQPWLVGFSFFLFYVAVTALSLPGAAIMTLAAGAFFGLWLGLLIVSFASSVGATVAFLVSRYLFRDAIQNKFGDKLSAFNEGVEREGGFYLFTLRLVPVFPFFVINLLMGLTPIKAKTFYWVSQVGMLAGTFIYVNAGTQLSELESASGIFSPGIIISFVLLGIFPWVAKRIVDFVKKRKVYSQWNKPKKFDTNMVVIGAGSAGLVSALIAATVKAKVTLVEANKMGGDCLNYGCVPSKALIKSATVAKTIRSANKYGLQSSDPSFNFSDVMARIHSIIKEIEPHDSVERYTGLGVDVLQGYGKLIDPWTVEVKMNDGTTKKVTTKSVVIAAGAHPFVPPLPGIEDVGYVTSDTLWDKFANFEAPPKTLVVLGGGPIGCELSQSFARLGSQVIQIEMQSRIMIREDEEVSAFVKERLEADGVKVLTDHKALHFEIKSETKSEINNGNKTIIVENNGKEITIEFDEMICAVGRSARLKGYGLEDIGIDTDKTVVTDDYLETKYPNIYAAGDVAGPFQFTHTASHQAWYAAVNALFGDFKKFKADYRVIPWTTFVDPEVSRVGINEQEAIEKNIPYEVSRYGIDDLDRAITESAAEGFVKILTVPGKDKILGVTIVGAHAGELLAEYVLAMKHGLGLNKILGTIHTYPTWSEANKYAAGNWKRAHAPEGLLKWVEKFHTWRRH